MIPLVPHYRDDLLYRHVQLSMLIYIKSLRDKYGLLGLVLKIGRFHEVVKVIEAHASCRVLVWSLGELNRVLDAVHSSGLLVNNLRLSALNSHFGLRYKRV